MTSETKFAHLPDRGVIAVSGADAMKFLQGLLTNDVAGLSPSTAAHAALLSPQGKILFDMLVLLTDGDTYLLDCPAGKSSDLVRRLTMYKLRADVRIADQSAERCVFARWNGTEPGPIVPGADAFADPRHPGLGERLIVPVEQTGAVATTATADHYHAHRIGLGVPEGGRDFVFGEAYPHEALFDRLHGVSFTKGCYVGQEIVARMQHRGTARKRIVPIRAAAELTSGAPVLAGEVEIGTIGSVMAADGGGSGALALIRLDRVEEAREKGLPITSGGAAVDVDIPDWAKSPPAAQA